VRLRPLSREAERETGARLGPPMLDTLVLDPVGVALMHPRAFTSRSRFDLIAEPWIPVVTHAGRPDVLGISATLENAHSIAEIVGDDPLVTAALLRVLLAVADRVQPLADLDDWQAASRRGAFDPADVAGYLRRWRDRFDLFHPHHPFAQGPPVPGAHATTVAQLIAGYASGNNATIASHVIDARPPRTTPAAAARHLLAHLAFAAGGRIPNHSSSCRAAPLRHGVVVTLAGESLYRTLLLNQLVSRARSSTDGVSEAPYWERSPTGASGEAASAGWLDRLVWPTRWVTLHPEADAAGLSVSRVTLRDGLSIPRGAPRDAMHATARARRARTETVLRPRSEGQAWRDVPRILPGSDDAGPPAAMAQLLRLALGGHLPPDAVYAVRWLGVAARHAKNLAFIDESTPLPVSLLIDDDSRERLERALAHAEATARGLAARVGLPAQVAVGGTSGGELDAATSMAVAGGEAIFWAALTPHARALVRDVSTTPAAIPAWRDAVRRAAQRATDAMGRRLGRAGLRAAAWFTPSPSNGASP